MHLTFVRQGMAIASACDAAGIALEPRSDGDGVPPVEPVIGIRATPSKRVLIRFVWHRRTQPIASVQIRSTVVRLASLHQSSSRRVSTQIWRSNLIQSHSARCFFECRTEPETSRRSNLRLGPQLPEVKGPQQRTSRSCSMRWRGDYSSRASCAQIQSRAQRARPGRLRGQEQSIRLL